MTGTAGNASATINWTPPANNGGSAITSYIVTASNGQTCTSGISQLICVFSGLTNGTSYTFTVKATNAVGSSVASAAVTVTPTAGTATCSATVSTSSTWNGGAVVIVTIHNGSVATKTWSVGTTWPKSYTVSSSGNANFTPTTGTTITFTNIASQGNGVIAPNGTYSFQFNATFSGTYTAPTTPTCSAT